MQPGKKSIKWTEVSCSAASGESVILGFGNGALAVLSARGDYNVRQVD